MSKEAVAYPPHPKEEAKEHVQKADVLVCSDMTPPKVTAGAKAAKKMKPIEDSDWTEVNPSTKSDLYTRPRRRQSFTRPPQHCREKEGLGRGKGSVREREEQSAAPSKGGNEEDRV